MSAAPRLACISACCLVAILTTVLSMATADEPTKAPANPESKIDFDKQIKPLLSAKCWSCHGAETQENHLRLARYDRRFAGIAAFEQGGAAVKSQMVLLSLGSVAAPAFRRQQRLDLLVEVDF